MVRCLVLRCYLPILIFLNVDIGARDGYNLWLNYSPINDNHLKEQYIDHFSNIVITTDGNIIKTSARELELGLTKMLEIDVSTGTYDKGSSNVIIGVIGQSVLIDSLLPGDIRSKVKNEGYCIYLTGRNTVIAGIDQPGVLYGIFHFLRNLTLNLGLQEFEAIQNPKLKLRLLNHWDNLDRTVERGYAGFSIWNWHELPEFIDKRYIDYARANASIGINGAAVTNVNANALIFRKDYLEKAAALANVFRDYGIKLYLTARFSAPIEQGGLKTADPLDPVVQQWWNEKVSEIYDLIPDFGGFLVKANSEGQPGPQNFGRSHAEGANMLARSLKPFGGIVMWRAFVYSNEEPVDRAKQAYNEFVPLDGMFMDNVIVQVKNGPIDFQPREPVHPLFGAMKETPLMMEIQITKEYLGQGTHLVGLSKMYEEVLDTDTYVEGKGSTVAKIIDGSITGQTLTGMAGVSNIGTARNWTGNLFGQADWYALGRLAWNPYLKSETIFDEWSKLTFSIQPKVVENIKILLSNSHEACVKYMTPLGLHHIMAAGHHYGPGPWVSEMSRADWTSVYYHKADSLGIGFDRTISGSNALEQYSQGFREKFEDPKHCPPEYLLWFHRVEWTAMLDTGKSLWDEICHQYHEGSKIVDDLIDKWVEIKPYIDKERFEHVLMHLKIQKKESIWWRDACLSYFQQFSNLSIPTNLEQPKHTLDYYMSISHPYAPGIRPRW